VYSTFAFGEETDPSASPASPDPGRVVVPLLMSVSFLSYVSNSDIRRSHKSACRFPNGRGE
jgi:hypothetical protein